MTESPKPSPCPKRPARAKPRTPKPLDRTLPTKASHITARAEQIEAAITTP
jgi:hypothetical protein